MTRRQALRALGCAALVGGAASCGRRTGAKGAKPDPATSPKNQPVSPEAPTQASAGNGGAGGNAPPPEPSDPRRAAPRHATVRRGVLLGPGTNREAGQEHHYLSLVDLDAAKLQARPIPTAFYGHGLAFDPLNPGRAVLFEKHGAGCCELDLRAGEVRRTIPTTKERQFYGHGVFSADGKLLLATETVVADGSQRGVIVVRDGKSFAPLGTFPSYGEAPHDCHLTDGGRTLVVTNGGGTSASGRAPNVAYIDVASRKLKERVVFDSPRVNAGHLALSKRGDLVVVSAPRDGLDVKAPDVHGGVSFRPHGAAGPLKTAKVALVKKMRAETLSVAIDDRHGVAAATSPGGGFVSFWDVKTGKLMSSLDDLPQPRGVTMALDGSCFAVTWGKGASLTLLDPMTLRPMAGGTLRRSWMSGSHVVVHRLGG